MNCLSKEKDPTGVRSNSDYRLTGGRLCGNLVAARIQVIVYHKTNLLCQAVQVRLFRASKKTSNSGEPASPIADSSPSCERIKTDYNSYLYTWCSLIVINNLQEIVRLARGMVSFKINQKRLTSE